MRPGYFHGAVNKLNLNVAKYVSQATLKKICLKFDATPSYSYPLWVSEFYRSRNTCCHTAIVVYRVVCSNPIRFENY